MAPLLFTLLAEGSLARRRKILEEADEAIRRLDRIEGEVGHRVLQTMAAAHVELSAGMEAGSISEADIFGEHLFGESDEPFDSSEGNPFASHLRRLAADLECPGIVEVERDGLRYRVALAPVARLRPVQR